MSITIEHVTLCDYPGERKTMPVHSFSGFTESFDPDALIHALRPIARQLEYHKDAYIVGLDGPGTVPAFALGICLRRPVIFSTKTKLARSHIHFTEPNSPRPDIYVYGLHRGMRVILVDDGIDTGNTLTSCIEGLEANGITVVAIVALIERKNAGSQMLREHDHKVHTLESYSKPS